MRKFLVVKLILGKIEMTRSASIVTNTATMQGTVAVPSGREGLVLGRHEEGIQNHALTREAVADNEIPKTVDLLGDITEETAGTEGIEANPMNVGKMKGLPVSAVGLL